MPSPHCGIKAYHEVALLMKVIVTRCEEDAPVRRFAC
jgi:hypothetical protein